MVSKKVISQNIKESIDEFTLKKIYPVSAAKELAKILYILKGKDKSIFTKKRGKNSGKFDIPNKKVWEVLVECWDYGIALRFTRKELTLMDGTGRYIYDKFDSYTSAETQYRNEFKNIEQDWLVSQGNLNQYIQQVKRKKGIPERERQRLVTTATLNAYQRSRFTEIRNDFIEYEIFKNNDNIFPTLKNSAGVDYFLDGVPFDQKVSSGLGRSFISEFDSEEEAVSAALTNPDKLALSLFENQDVSRLETTNLNRLYVIFLDGGLPDNIKFKSLSVSKLKSYNLKFKLNKTQYPGKAIVLFV